MWVKICANTNLEDAQLAAELGADAVGFVFAPSSRRVTAAQVAAITKELPDNVERIGVFSGFTADEVAEAVRTAGLTGVQMHDRMDLDLIRALTESFEGRLQLIQTVHWVIDGTEEDEEPVCLGGRGATPPESCGGPTGYRLMLKRQREGSAMLEPVMVESGIRMLTKACPDQPAQTWDLLRTPVDDGLRSIDLRLKEFGPLQPNQFSLQEANERLNVWKRRRRFRA